MQPFTQHTGKIALLDRANVDTDQIIPKHHLKSIRRTGFGEGLFSDWRYRPDGSLNPDFELNRPAFKDATILVARNNFGCGSSREHAVWAIQQYGFRAVIAPARRSATGAIPGFADIFKSNSGKNGLLLIELTEAEVEQIFQQVRRQADEVLEAAIDLPAQTLTLLQPGKESQQDQVIRFKIDPGLKQRFTDGLDDIGLTLRYLKEIQAFEHRHNPQLYRSKNPA